MRLLAYASVYAQTYGSEEPIVELVSAMLITFLKGIASSPEQVAAALLRCDVGEQLLSVAEAAAFLKVHANTVRAWVRSGRIPGAKIGREWRFIEADLVTATREHYPASARMQPSALQEEALWHSGSVQEPMT